MKSLITLALVLGSYLLMAQTTTFNHAYLNPYLPYGGASGRTILIHQDTLFVFGAIVVEDAHTNNILQKYNLDGDLISTQIWDPEDESLDANPGRFAAVDYTISGDSSFFTVPYSEFNNSIDFGMDYIMLLDQNGNELYRHPLDWDERYDFTVYQSRSLNANEHLFCGASWDSTGIGPLDDSGFLLKTNEFGETLWAQTYDSVAVIEKIQPMVSGNILLGGYIDWGGTQGGENLADNILIKTDSMGEEHWRYIYGFDGSQRRSAILEVTDGSIISVSIDGSLHNGLNGLDEGPYWFQRIQDNGDSFEIIDEASYGEHYIFYRWPFTIKETSDGGFITSGFGESHYDAELDFIVEQGIVMKVDENLDSLWWRYYEHYEDAVLGTDIFYDMVLGDEGSIYLTGKAEEGAFADYQWLSHIWLVKLDSLGCLEPGCNDLDTTYVESYIIGLQNSMKVFTNPVQNQLQIEFTLPSNFHLDGGSSLLIIDSQGRTIGNHSLQDNLYNTHLEQIDVSYLSSGLYTVHWVSDDKKWMDSVSIIKN